MAGALGFLMATTGGLRLMGATTNPDYSSRFRSKVFVTLDNRRADESERSMTQVAQRSSREAMARATVCIAVIRANGLSLAGTTVHGHVGVLVKSIMSATATS